MAKNTKSEARKSIIIISCDIYRIKNVNLNNSHTEDRITVGENIEIKINWLTDVYFSASFKTITIKT